MTDAQFQVLLEGRLKSIGDVLAAKATEYSSGKSRMHNFEVAASLSPGQTDVQAAWGMAKKHLVSIIDMVEGDCDGPTTYDAERVKEKFGDMINYLILIEAIFLGRGMNWAQEARQRSGDDFTAAARSRATPLQSPQ